MNLNSTKWKHYLAYFQGQAALSSVFYLSVKDWIIHIVPFGTTLTQNANEVSHWLDHSASINTRVQVLFRSFNLQESWCHHWFCRVLLCYCWLLFVVCERVAKQPLRKNSSFLWCRRWGPAACWASHSLRWWCNQRWRRRCPSGPRSWHPGR